MGTGEPIYELRRHRFHGFYQRTYCLRKRNKYPQPFHITFAFNGEKYIPVDLMPCNDERCEVPASQFRLSKNDRRFISQKLREIYGEKEEET